MGVRMRYGLGLAVGLSAVALGSGVAYACLDPEIAPSQRPAGPGDTVTFTIDNTDVDARYTVTVNGREVTSGVDEDTSPGTSGSFVMPDFGGSARKVSVGGSVEHEGGVDSSGNTLVACSPCPLDPGSVPYAPPSAAPAQSGAPSSGGEQPAPSGSGSNAPSANASPGPTPSAPASRAPSRVPTNRPSSTPARDPSPAKAGAGERPGKADAATPSRAGRAEALTRAVASPTPDALEAAAAAVQPAGVASGEPRGGDGSRSAKKASTGLASAPLVGDGRLVAERPIPATASAPRGREGGVLGWLAVGVGILVLLAIGGAGTRFVRSRLSGPPRSSRGAEMVRAAPVVEAEDALRMLAMEAELQEIVAEERAKEILAPAPYPASEPVPEPAGEPAPEHASEPELVP